MHLELHPSDFASMDDSQRLAVLETMVVGLVADNKVTPDEVQKFEQIVMSLPWGVDKEVLGSMIHGAQQRLMAFKSPVEIHDYVARLATRLPTPALRDKVVFTMATLMFSDGEIDRVEKNVLGMFVIAFGITSDRLAAIKAALAGAPPPAPAKPTGN